MEVPQSVGALPRRRQPCSMLGIDSHVRLLGRVYIYKAHEERQSSVIPPFPPS